MIYSHTIADRVLSSLIQDTSLCLNSKYPIEKEDFECVQFHKILFSTIYNLAIKGVKRINVIDIEEFLEPYNVQKEVYESNNGNDYIATIIELGNKDNYEYYYNELRKHSCLREYKKQGFDIAEIYDESKEDNFGLDGWKIEDIVGYFDKKQNEQKKKFVINANIEVCDLGEDYSLWLDELEEDPMIGAGICSPIINNLYRGWCKGHCILRGSPSSFGKTLMGIADQISVSSKKIWSEEKKDFIINPYYQGRGAYCHSEQKIKEISHRFGSTISGIPYHVILDGEFKNNKDYRERLDEAGKIMKESGLKVINYPTFTASGLKDLFKSLSIDGFEYVTQDYIWNNFHIVADLKNKMGVNNIMEYQALLYLADTYKISAEEYNIGIATMMQLNGNEKTAEIVEESCLFAGRQVKTKIDNGSIYMYPRSSELKQVEPLIEKWNKKHNPIAFGQKIMPNAVSHCFKTRFGRYGQNVKVWHFVDNGIGRMTDMFSTTFDNKPLEVPPLYIERSV